MKRPRVHFRQDLPLCKYNKQCLTQWRSGRHHPSPAVAAVTTVATARAVMTAVMTVMMAAATTARLTAAVIAFKITAVFTVRMADAACNQM